MKLVCCCLSQAIDNLFHLITTLRCSNIDQDSQPNTHPHTPNPPNTPNTHPPRKRGKGKIGKEGKEEKRGKGTRTIPHPAPQNIYLQPKLISRTTTTPHTKGKRKR